MSKEYNNPIPVAVMIIYSQDGIVYIKRKNEPGAGLYALPGGYVNEREHPKQAAIREAFEETNIQIHDADLLDVLLSEQTNQIVFFYQSRNYIKTIRETMKAGDDAEECIIHPYDEEFINKIAFSTHREAVYKYYAF